MAASAEACLAATRTLLTDVIHAFGVADLAAITPDGAFRLGQFGDAATVAAVASAHGIAVTHDRLD